MSYVATVQQLALLHPQLRERAEPLDEGIYVRLAVFRDTTAAPSRLGWLSPAQEADSRKLESKHRLRS